MFINPLLFRRGFTRTSINKVVNYTHLWYNYTTLTTDTPLLCSQCGSPLILVSEKTEVIEGSRFPQTTKIYKCSNESCQDEIDKQTAKRKQLQNERVTADTKRAAEKQTLQARRKDAAATEA